MLDTLRERLADLDVNASNTAIAEAIMALMNGNSVNDLRSLVNSNDFINQLADYLTNQQATTTTTQPSTTAPTTTTAPATTAAPTTTAPYSTDLQAPSIVIPSVSYTYTYQGAQTYSTEATTADIYATEPPYSYMEPAVSYTNTLTTVPFTPVYEDDGSSLKNSSSVKLVIGICVLILSAGSIAAIVVMLKKNKA